MKELVAVNARDIEIDKAVIVIVSCPDAHRVSNALQTRGLGHIGKCAVTIVAIEAVPIAGIRLFERRDCRAIGEEDIEQAVIVVVENGYSTQHCLDGIVLGADAVTKRETDF